jgi:hypothetical protein
LCAWFAQEGAHASTMVTISSLSVSYTPATQPHASRRLPSPRLIRIVPG